jgi:hypothetical protein
MTSESSSIFAVSLFVSRLLRLYNEQRQEYGKAVEKFNNQTQMRLLKSLLLIPGFFTIEVAALTGAFNTTIYDNAGFLPFLGIGLAMFGYGGIQLSGFFSGKKIDYPSFYESQELADFNHLYLCARQADNLVKENLKTVYILE